MATKSIAWNTGSGNITLTYQGQGDGTITVQSDPNSLGTSRSQTITVETVGGAITKNLTVSQTACPVPVGTVLSYSYTGSYQEVTLPAGQYKLQCWGAKGGSNAAASSYSITAKAGGKGGYSEGVITLSQVTVFRIYVGGQGSSSAGGFNGGGSTSGSSSYSTGTSGQSGYHYGTSRMGGGGGATDIRLSDGALLSRMIVAGGGSGGAMCYSKTTTSTSRSETINWQYYDEYGGGSKLNNFTSYSASGGNASWSSSSGADLGGVTLCLDLSSYSFPVTVSFKVNSAGGSANLKKAKAVNKTDWTKYSSQIVNSGYSGTGTKNITLTDSTYPVLFYYCGDNKTSMSITATVRTWTETSTSTSNDSQVGGVGGGTQGGGYSTSYVGKQNAAGSGGAFGQGAAQSATNYRYCSGAGGGGWYGGGTTYSDSGTTSCKYGGGGSGFVNTSASAGNRPSGYTGLQLDSGTTYAGNTSFPNTAGTGNETGHSGNGYAKITRLA